MAMRQLYRRVSVSHLTIILTTLINQISNNNKQNRYYYDVHYHRHAITENIWKQMRSGNIHFFFYVNFILLRPVWPPHRQIFPYEMLRFLFFAVFI